MRSFHPLSRSNSPSRPATPRTLLASVRRFGFLGVLGVTFAVATGPVVQADERDRVLGEATELTDAVRAEVLQHLEVIQKADPEQPATVKAAVTARRALLRSGPVVWPVVENALRLNPSAGARPHLQLVKALMAKKSEREFEALRARLRKRFLMDDLKGMHEELSKFRLGLPDPAKPGKRLKLSVTPTKQAGIEVYRSSDRSIVVAYGVEADANNPDAPETSVSDPMAGFLAVMGGKGFPFERQSGRGADTSAEAPNGFAWAWATDGAPGKAPGGTGGAGGTAMATGGAGTFQRSGNGGAGAPG